MPEVKAAGEEKKTLFGYKRDKKLEREIRGGGILGKDDFLKLLIVEMKHQTPFNPLDNRKFAEQMAQFTTLEQILKLNDRLEEVLQSAQQTSALSLLGKKVKAQDDSGNITSGKVEGLKYEQGVPKLVINNVEFALKDIVEVEV